MTLLINYMYSFSYYFSEDKAEYKVFEDDVEKLAKGVFSNIDTTLLVSGIDYDSVVNENGKYRQILKKMENVYHVSQSRVNANDPWEFDFIIDAIIKKSNGTFQSFMYHCKVFLKKFREYSYAFNVVYYTEYAKILYV